jgi:diguanylate cyclase (GGDEF)-like protein/putative nucleotidyltransferase with HDIG domain
LFTLTKVLCCEEIVMEGILHSIIEAGYRQLEGRGMSLYRFDPLSETFPDVWELEDGQVIRRYASRALPKGFTDKVLRQGVPIVVNNTQLAEGLSPRLPSATRSFIATVVRVRDLPWGVLYVTSPAPNVFHEDDQAFVSSLARQMGNFIQETNRPLAGTVELSTVRVLAATVDAKDHYTRHHSTNVSFYARLLAREMYLAPEEIRWIELAGLLHDIGKIAIPDQILQKPGMLSAEERLMIQTHAAIGANILAQASHLRHLVSLVRHHHEWWDGTGYPDGLKGKEIPLGAAILCLADAFDTMTTKRVYRPALTLDEAMVEVRRCSGLQFHPDAVAALVSLVEKARYTREPWLLSLGTFQETRVVLPEHTLWQGMFEGDRTGSESRWDPLDFLVEARLVQFFDDLPSILQRAGQQAMGFWQVDAALVYLGDRQSGTLKLAWAEGSAAAQRFLATCQAEGSIPMTRGLLGWAALTNQGICVPDARRDSRWPYAGELDGPVSVVVAPIAASGATLGVIQMVSQGESRFGTSDIKVVKVFSTLLGQAIDRVKSAQESQEAYCTDALTGVRNANYLRTYLEQLELGGLNGPFSVAFLDSDDLKGVNDRHGHQAGDLMIRHVSRCLQACQREEDKLVRYAGDEFLVFFPGLALPEAAARLERMRMAVSETPVEFEGHRIYVSVSCGVTEVDVALGPHKALRAAEQAMYNAKRTGKNRVWTAAV